MPAMHITARDAQGEADMGQLPCKHLSNSDFQSLLQYLQIWSGEGFRRVIEKY